MTHEVGTQWCSLHAGENASGDSFDTEVWNWETAACGMTTTVTGNYPYQTVDCLNSGITDADQDQVTRWRDVFTDTAFEVVILDYFYEQDTTKLTFPEYVSNYFNGPENMNCGKSDVLVGCETMSECSDTNYPAGYFILNSFVVLHEVSLKKPYTLVLLF